MADLLELVTELYHLRMGELEMMRVRSRTRKKIYKENAERIKAEMHQMTELVHGNTELEDEVFRTLYVVASGGAAWKVTKGFTERDDLEREVELIDDYVESEDIESLLEHCVKNLKLKVRSIEEDRPREPVGIGDVGKYAIDQLPKLLSYFKKTAGFAEQDDYNAYTMAILSELAYYNIPDLELDPNENIEDRNRRIKKVPCHEYQWLLTSGQYEKKKTKVSIKLDEGDEIVEFYSWETDRMIVSSFTFTGTTVFAIRGTAKAYDWVINSNGNPYEYKGRTLHTGFYEECLKHVDEFDKFFKTNRKKVKRVAFTGHSLGGAMAGVFETLWGELGTDWPPSVGGYTFAMPSFGDEDTMKRAGRLYHFFNEDDVVPKLPGGTLGYGHLENEWTIGEDGSKAADRSTMRSLLGNAWSNIWNQTLLHHHSMELHRYFVGKVVDAGRRELMRIDRTNWPGTKQKEEHG